MQSWRGNVGAHHEPTHRIPLDYRLRDSQFYREKIIRLLKDLEETLRSGAFPKNIDKMIAFADNFLATSLLLGERPPFEDVVSASVSEAASEKSSSDDAFSDFDEVDLNLEQEEGAVLGSVSFALL